MANARSRAHPVGLGRTESFSRSAVTAPSPGSGEVRKTALPDTFDGIRFEIGRMGQYVTDAARDPVVQRQAQEIQATYGRMVRDYVSMGRTLSQTDDKAIQLQAIDDWCREHAVYVNDPPNVEVIQTPRRMVKQTKVPARLIQYLMTPFYDAFAEASLGHLLEDYVPRKTYIGDCDELVTCMQGLAVCTFLDRKPKMGAQEKSARFFFQFGGNEGTLHHVWAKTVLDGVDYHADHTEPGFTLGDHSKFEAYEDVEILP